MADGHYGLHILDFMRSTCYVKVDTIGRENIYILFACLLITKVSEKDAYARIIITNPPSFPLLCLEELDT